MTYGTAFFSALACAFALAASPAGAGVASDAGTAMGTERISSDEIGELKELLVAHGIPPARHLAAEISREITGSNREAATAALFRPPVVHAPGAAPAPTAVAQAGKAGGAEPARADTPRGTQSPVRNLLRRVLRFLNFSN
ncbi:MAG: hypothetical protein OXI11_03020 [Gammaproteobacteria bacterium]|nr:hypothetical protein [Gammaproteobacteria bacterium]MXW46013.1 hypothetical protein [Gammaproteobacteria bacterium]MYD02424.1 hypothetical protein [Gammaproteobacteria bacterium]MYI25910.1 hypothetical protein [Gammaproteobacteria bacterium]